MRVHISTFASITVSLVLGLQASAVPCGSLYWSDNVGSNIQSIGLDGTGRTTIIGGLKVPSDVVVASGLNKIYWGEQASSPYPQRIRRANLDGTQVETVASLSDNPQAIALDEQHGKLYWNSSNTGQYGVMQSGTLDGGSVRNLPLIFNGTAESICVDAVGHKLYWVESGNNRLCRSNFDGTQFEIVVTNGLDHPTSLCLDPVEHKLYWSNVGSTFTTGSIARANLDGTGVEVIVPRDITISCGWCE